MATNAKKSIREKLGTRATRVETPKAVTSSRIKKEEKSLAKSASGRKFSFSGEELNARIQQKAYELFEKRGYKEGFADFDWATAEKIVLRELERAKLPAKKRFDFKTSEELNQKIQERAYAIYLAQGQQDGHDAFNWYLAEDLVLLENN